MRIRKIGLTWGLVALLSGLMAASALAAPALEVDLSNDPTTLPRDDEGMFYTVKVKNTAGGNPDVGDLLTCNHRGPFGNPTPAVEYQWLRNGDEIVGTGKTYVIVEADQSKALQCKVTATSDPDGPDATFAPISEQQVSLPPVVVAPSPSPALPSGTSAASLEGRLSLPTGTATTTAGSNVLTEVITARGTGTFTAGSTSVTGVSMESGIIDGGGNNPIVGPGIPTGSGTATFVRDSTAEIHVSGASGTFAVGQRMSGTGTAIDGQPIIAVGPDWIRLCSVNCGPNASGTFSFTAYTRLQAFGADTLTLSAAAIASGTHPFAAGTFPFGPGHTISGDGIPPGTEVLEATGNGTDGLEIVMSNDAMASASEVAISGGSEASCNTPNGWSGEGLTWSFKWLRNGIPILGAIGPAYTLTKDDTEPPSNLQCEATVEDTSGNKAVTMSSGSTTPRWPAPYFAPNVGVPTEMPTVAVPNTTSGPVTLEVELPSGQETFLFRSVGTGSANADWHCTSQMATSASNAKAICTREEALDPGESYPSLGFDVNLGADAPEVGTAIATVSGGNSPPASDEATYTFTPGETFGMLPGSFEAGVFNEAGEPDTKAGGHPYRGYATFGFTVKKTVSRATVPVGDIKDVVVDTPRGFVGNANASPALCPSIDDMLADLCPLSSAVGGVDIFAPALGTPTGDESPYPNDPGYMTPNLALYSFLPEFGAPAQFAFAAGPYPYTFVPELRPEEGYAISFRTAPIIKNPNLYGTNVDLCNFGAKFKAGNFEVCRKAGEPGANEIPLFTNPTRCSGPPPANRLRINSWQNPEDIKTYDYIGPQITECEDVKFEPEATLEPTNRQADSPTGLEVEFSMPTDGLLVSTGISQANLDTAKVTFPQGMTINAAAAEGLTACTPAQVQL